MTKKIATSPADFAACRTLGHAWGAKPDFNDDTLEYDPSWSQVMSVHCLRCATQRIDVVDMALGDVVKRRYKYAPGYRHDPDDLSKPPRRSTWRLLFLQTTR